MYGYFQTIPTEYENAAHNIWDRTYANPEVIEWLESEGDKQGMGYQTFLNWFLKKSMDDHESFEDRLEKLEHTVFRKKA